MNPVTRKKSVQGGVTASIDIPSGNDPMQNAWLTLTLHYDLTFVDRNTPEDIVVFKDGRYWAKDSDGYLFPIRDWDFNAITKFHKMFKRAENIWNHKFLIITPTNYDGLDYTSYAGQGWVVRPNVLCLFRMETTGKARAHNFKVVRLDTLPDEVEHFQGKLTKDTSVFGFRSNHKLLTDEDPYTPTLGHELGHALGLEHIKVLKGDAQCSIDQNAQRCYGETIEELMNIMGVGREITAINALPWQNHLESITGERKERWSLVVFSDTKNASLVPRRVPMGVVNLYGKPNQI